MLLDAAQEEEGAARSKPRYAAPGSRLPVSISGGAGVFVRAGARGERSVPSHAEETGEGEENQGGGHEEGQQDKTPHGPGE